nr:DUF211 domain-containing protein [Methanothermobacter sp. THM-2]
MEILIYKIITDVLLWNGTIFKYPFYHNTHIILKNHGGKMVAKGLIRIVLDILKPHEPIIPEYAKYLSELRGVEGVNITLMEIDKETENIKVTIQGNDLDFDEITRAIESYGGSIHSVDEVVAGKTMVEEVTTPQD